MYYSYVVIEYVATSFSPARMDLALKLLIEIDSNAILVEAMKNCLAGEMIQAYQVLVERLRSAGLTPKMHILDNECSTEFKEQIVLNNMKY